MAKIIAPNKYYTGVSAGVVFKDGVGESSDPHLLAWFVSKGYTVEGLVGGTIIVEPEAPEERAIGEPAGPDPVKPEPIPAAATPRPKPRSMFQKGRGK